MLQECDSNMKIGYACLTIGVPNTNYKTCILKNATEENLLNILEHNLNVLENMIHYNMENNIKLFRISSSIIPFGSSPANKLGWWDIFSDKFNSIGEKIKASGMRVSMHPGQYTVLNSPTADVVDRAIEDLNYHNRFLDSLNVDKSNKIILHIGGVYNDKDGAIIRFIENYKRLSQGVKNRLVIENDDKCYNIGEVLYIGSKLDIPVVYDNLHNKILPYDTSKDDLYWISRVNKTWKRDHGLQKIHYSQQDPDKKPGAHSTTIRASEFMKFVEGLDRDLDIMLEVKDKNLSAVKCVNLLDPNMKIKNLELEWSKYKYSVLEYSNNNYNKIRQLLKDKEDYPVLEFYSLIEDSLQIEATKGSVINALQHVWGYFKSIASNTEKARFEKMLAEFNDDQMKLKTIKNYLFRLAIKYNVTYLLDSYYFYI